MQDHKRPRRRAKHRFPVCPVTGKVRFGEMKDVRLALREARAARGRAGVLGLETSRREIRGYRCKHCSGLHLTSQVGRKWGQLLEQALRIEVISQSARRTPSSRRLTWPRCCSGRAPFSGSWPLPEG